MDVAASVIAIWQLTCEVTQYLNDVKNAPKECQQCAIEASNLLGPLISLRYHAERAQSDDPWFEELRKLNVKDGPLDQYKEALELLRTKVGVGDETKQVKRRLLWKFTKEQVAGILARIERLKNLVSVALQMDHRKLSDAIKDDTACIRASLPPLQARAVAIEAGIHTLHDETRSVKDDTTIIRDAIPPLQASTAAVRDAQTWQDHEKVVNWLSPTDYPAQQHDIISRRQEGTAEWFLDSAEFNQWVRGLDKTLFCPGMPGAGKTMMAAVAIDHLCQTTHSKDVGIAYLFCSYKAQVDQTAPNLLAALLKQLIQVRPDVATPVTKLYDRHAQRQTKPSLDELTQALTSVCSSYPDVYIIVDALDECSNQDGARKQLINKLRSLQINRNIRLLLTSRAIPDVTEEFQSTSSLEVRASEEDVKRYVSGQLPRLPNCIQRDDGLANEVQTRIAAAVDGMFLLARLHVDSLLDKKNKHLVLSTLNKMSKGSAALEDAYGEAITRIDGQLEQDRLLAKRALCWISYARRLLTTTELCHALAIEPGDRDFNDDRLYDAGDIISVCAGLVTVDDESGIIRLVHYTTQDYIEQVRQEWHPIGREEIAVACLTYLSFDSFASGSCPSRDLVKHRCTKYPLLRYSVDHWSEHVRPVQDCAPVTELALAFLCNDMLVDSVIQVVCTFDMDEDCIHTFPSMTRGLHLTARYGLLYLSQSLLTSRSRDGSSGVDAEDSRCKEPLAYAASGGHEAVAKLLMDAGANVNAINRRGTSALYSASQSGHDAVVKLLIEASADVNNDNAIREASWNGHEAVVKLLVEAGADVNAQADFDGTALQFACLYGYEGIVKLLLHSGADVNAPSRGYGTALQGACYFGHEGIVKLLLHSGADVNAQGGEYGTALQAASKASHEGIVKLLLHSGADVNAQGGEYGTALQAASKASHEGIVKLLLHSGADVNAQGGRHGTALQAATYYGHKGVVKLLIDAGAS